MKKKTIMLACILMCMACLAMVFNTGCSTDNSAVDTGETESQEETEGDSAGGVLSEGDSAPDFTAKLMGGGEFKLSDHKDKVVLINFWATWCGYCVDEMPELEKLDKENIDGLEIILVDCMETEQEVNDFIKDNGFTFTVAYDEDGKIEMKYPTAGIPYTVIVKDGIVQKTFVGMPNDPYNTYKNAVEELL